MSFTVSLMFFLVSAQLVIFTSGEIFSDRATFRFSRTGGGSGMENARKKERRDGESERNGERARERGGKEGITELNVCAEKGGRGGQRRRVRGCRRREERGGDGGDGSMK